MRKITSNSNIRIQWHDKRENYSKTLEKEIIAYTRNKYKCNFVKVEFTATNKLNIGITDLDDSDVLNINRPETQEKIIVGWLKDNNVEIKFDDIIRLNKRVESTMDEFSDFKDNKWKLKKLTIENFLSYKDKFTIDFEALQGITLIQGENYSGKSTLITDALLFLFFNKTTKTKSADDIINRFVDTDFAQVEGEIEIEGVDYKIIRKIQRHYKKDKVTLIKTSTDLAFETKNENGEYKEPDKEEDRNATEKKIKENIGNMKEFLMTVMCTGSNIFTIIDALPTERGLYLSKFLGLEIFEKKETIAKDLYNDWKKKSKIDKYISSDLEIEIESNLNLINENKLLIESLNNELQDILIIKDSFVKEKEDFLTYLNKDIDSSMVNLNENYFFDRINEIKNKKNLKKDELNNILEEIHPIIEDFNQVLYNEYLSKQKELERKILLIENDIFKLKKDIHNLKSGEKCSTCGQSLKDVDHTNEINEKIEKNVSFDTLLITYQNELKELLPLIEALEIIHKKIIANDNLTLKKDKIEVEIERFELALESEETKLKKFKEDINKIKVNKDLEEKIRLKNIDILEQSNRETSKKREIQSLDNTNLKLNEKNQDNKELVESLKKEEHISKVFSTYINMVGKNGISKTIIKNSVPALNLELQRLLNDSAQFTVEIDVNVKNNEVEFWMIDNETEKRALLISGSGYEKTVAALALRFVFTKVNTLPKPSLFLNDEIFSTVSNINLELVKIFMDKVAETIDNIFIITHNELVKEWADNIITVTKENNISKVNY